MGSPRSRQEQVAVVVAFDDPREVVEQAGDPP